MNAGILIDTGRIDVLLNKQDEETITSIEITELRELLKADCRELNEFQMAKVAFLNEYTPVYRSEDGTKDIAGNWLIDSTVVSEFHWETKGITKVVTDEGDFFYFTSDALQEYEAQLVMADSLTVEDLIIRDNLNEFLGSRELSSQLKKHLLSLREPLACVLHRGMSFPVHLLKIGGILEEWHGSSHWSKDFEVALGFANDGFVNSDYLDDLVESLEEDKDLLRKYNAVEAFDLFKKVVFRLTTNTEAIDVHKLVVDFNLADWLHEQEVTFIGTNFIMTNIAYVEDGTTPYYLVDVKEACSI